MLPVWIRKLRPSYWDKIYGPDVKPQNRQTKHPDSELYLSQKAPSKHSSSSMTPNLIALAWGLGFRIQKFRV